MKELFLNVYSVYDRVAGSYGEPFVAPNDGVASRRFNFVMAKSELIAEDCELYQVGKYDPETGTLQGLEKPKFLYRYEVTNEEA